jgi:hypothetical protein
MNSIKRYPVEKCKAACGISSYVHHWTLGFP